MLAVTRPDPRIAQIERARKAQGITHAELCRRANIGGMHWYGLRRGEWMPAAVTIERLQAALSGQYVGTPMPLLVKGLLGSAQAMIRLCSGDQLGEGRVRRLALYVVAVELEIENADLARAAGMSRQNVQQVRNIIEDMRERDAAIEALLTRCAALLRGAA